MWNICIILLINKSRGGSRTTKKCKTDLLLKQINGWKPLNFVRKNFILDFWSTPRYASEEGEGPTSYGFLLFLCVYFWDKYFAEEELVAFAKESDTKNKLF